MALSHDVRLRRATEVVFPDECVVCGAEGPGHATRVFTRETFNGLMGIGREGDPFVDVPSCPRCSRKIRAGAGVSLGVGFVSANLMYFFVADPYLLEPSEGLWHWFAWLATPFVCVLPWVLWRVCFPPAFSIDTDDAWVEFEFRKAAYAEAFERLNATLVVRASDA